MLLCCYVIETQLYKHIELGIVLTVLVVCLIFEEPSLFILSLISDSDRCSTTNNQSAWRCQANSFFNSGNNIFFRSNSDCRNSWSTFCCIPLVSSYLVCYLLQFSRLQRYIWLFLMQFFRASMVAQTKAIGFTSFQAPHNHNTLLVILFGWYLWIVSITLYRRPDSSSNTWYAMHTKLCLDWY